ncbi:hypothetical protein ACFL6U_05150 [Planctomycetota bacterium]
MTCKKQSLNPTPLTECKEKGLTPGIPAFYGTTDEFSRWAWQKADPFVEKYIINVNAKEKLNFHFCTEFYK